MTGPDIDQKALDSLSVTPPAPGKNDPKGDAGRDKSIEREMQRDPEDRDARLDEGLDESMDASDPPAAVQPGHGNEPAPSSGYPADRD